MSIDFNQLRELLAALNQTDIAELILKSPDFELTVRKGVSVVSAIDPSLVAQPQPIAATVAITPTNETVSATSPHPANDKKWVDIPSPIVGTFYRAPAPDEPPFVQVGDRIRSGHPVCIIEAMKVMNEIEAEVSGQVMEILVQNGQTVEYGQALMRVNPDQ